jgi:hypothetical protein
MDLITIIAAVGLPGAVITAVVGIIARRIEKRLDDEAKARREQEEARKEFERYQLEGLTATMKLCEANALALQHGHCNGETHAALEYMQQVKREQRKFLARHGLDHIF